MTDPTPQQLPPLQAIITRRDGKFVLEVSGVEIGEADDYAAATTRLCTEAAKYSRRVFVTVLTKTTRQHFEIDPDGTIERTTAPATGTGNPLPAPPSTITRPVGSPAETTRAPDSAQIGSYAAQPDLVAAMNEPNAAHGGYPAPVPVTSNGPGRADLRWRMRTLAPTLTRAAAVLAVAAGSAVVCLANLNHTDRSAADLAAWRGVQPATVAALNKATSEVTPAESSRGQETLLRRHASRHQVRLDDLAPTPATTTWHTRLGAVADTGQQWQFTAAGDGLSAYLEALAELGPAFHVTGIDRTDAGEATVTGRFISLTP